MNKCLEDRFFEDTSDLVANVMETIYENEDLFSVTIVAKYNDAQEIIRSVLADEDIRISAIDICSPEFSGYDEEYYISILVEDGVIELNCFPVISDGYYIDDDANITYIIENCNSRIIKHCEADERYIAIIGENERCYCDEECGCICCENCDDNIEIMCDYDGKAHGFTASKTEDDDTVYKSVTYYTSNDLSKDEFREILKGYGF